MKGHQLYLLYTYILRDLSFKKVFNALLQDLSFFQLSIFEEASLSSVLQINPGTSNKC